MGEKTVTREKRKERYGCFIKAREKALATNDERGMRQLFLEIGEDELRADIKETGKLLKKTLQRIPRGNQSPILPQCVYSIMEELREIGVWNGSSNTTYDQAIKALWSYENAKDNYQDSLTKLALNLVFKYSLPFNDTSRDPLGWFLERGEIVRLCNHRGIKISLRTLSTYQKQGLIRPPIRLGRKAHYSFLTVFRIITATDYKKSGHKLLDIKDVLNGTLQAMLEEFYKKFPDSRLFFEDAGVALVNIIRLEYGARFFEGVFWNRADNRRG